MLVDLVRAASTRADIEQVHALIGPDDCDTYEEYEALMDCLLLSLHWDSYVVPALAHERTSMLNAVNLD